MTEPTKGTDAAKDKMARVRAARGKQIEKAFTPPILSDDEGQVLGELGQLAALLGKAAGDAEREQTAVDGIWSSIANLSKDAQSRLFGRDEVRQLFKIAEEKDNPEAHAKPEDVPGTIYYRTIGGEKVPWTKKPWTWNYLWNHYPTKTWQNGERRIHLQFSGLNVTIEPHQEVTLPCVFHGMWQDRIKLQRDAEQHAAYMFGKRDQPPDDRGMVTAGTAFARSLSLGDREKQLTIYEPGGGFVAVAQKPDDE